MSYMNDIDAAIAENIGLDVARLTTENEALKARWNSLYESVQTAAFEATSNANQRLLMQVVTIMDELAGDISEVQHE